MRQTTSALPPSLLGARAWCVIIAIQFQAMVGPSADAGQPGNALGDRFPPLVVPVSRGAAPYDREAIWHAFTAGDTTPPSFRALYPGRACENTDFFLRREAAAVQPCRALVLAPWLDLVGSVPDSILAWRAVSFADSNENLAAVADSAGRVHALVAAVVGDRGAPRLIPLTYRSRHASRPVTVHGVVLTPLANERRGLSEDQLIIALPYVLGLPPQTLYRDQRGTLHLHPDAFGAAAIRSRDVLVGPKTLTLDTEVHSCGSMMCVTPYPVYWARLDFTPPRGLYLSVRYGEGVLVQVVPPLAYLMSQSPDSVASGEWVLVTPDGPGIVPLRSPGASLLVRWRGPVATVGVPPLH